MSVEGWVRRTLVEGLFGERGLKKTVPTTPSSGRIPSKTSAGV